MQALHASSTRAPRVHRSLTQMISDEEMRATMRILNAKPPARPVRSFAERYREAESDANAFAAARGRMSGVRLVALSALALGVTLFGVAAAPLAI